MARNSTRARSYHVADPGAAVLVHLTPWVSRTIQHPLPRRDSEHNAPTTVESISRVVSAALKSAAAVNGGTPDEKGALDVLGGLAALLDSRIQLHKHASLLSGAADAAAKPKPIAGGSPLPAPAAPTPDDKKRQVPE